MKDRKFGVEIECETNGCGYYGTKTLLTKNKFRKWAENVYEDGSEIEIPSPILQGREGFKELEKVMNLLDKEGFTTHSADGMHVHHDISDLNLSDIYRIFKSWHTNQREIEKCVNPYRRDNYYCKRLTVGDLHKILSLIKNQEKCKSDSFYYEEEVYIDKYRYLTGTFPDNERPTIEIRMHEGTLDFEKARAWILFGQSFINNVAKRKNPLNSLPFEDLVKRTKVAPSAARTLLKRYHDEP